MAYENEGLPGLYKRARKQKAIAAAPDGIKRNREEISKLKERVVALEKKINGSS